MNVHNFYQKLLSADTIKLDTDLISQGAQELAKQQREKTRRKCRSSWKL